jgi:hypothetical protein
VVKDPATVAPGAGEPTQPAVEITRYEVSLRRVVIACRTSEPGYLRAAFSWYPSLRVSVDGSVVTPLRSLLGAIVIPAEAGEHTIVLTPTSPWRMRSLMSAAAGILLILSSAVLARRP